jgi:aldehyde:ferredoxin oxidoreductase
MKGGYVGKLLFVDLSTGAIEPKELTDEMAKNFVGGYGIGARVLYSMMKPGADPLGTGNVLGLLTGPLTGTGAFFSGRFTAVCKSPVTGGWNDANSGGYFGPELKRAGFDGVFISGVAKTPVYLWVQDGKAEIRPADKLWGMDCSETKVALQELTGEDKFQEAIIGPGGEKLSPMACIMNDRHRAAGRGGCGAVMGSKMLKGVVVRGTGQVPVAHAAKLREINRSITAALKGGGMMGMASAFGEYGTGFLTTMSALSGDAPVKNWGGVGFVDFGDEAASELGAPTMDPKYKTKAYGCANCPLACGAHYEVNEGKWPVGKTDRPEYETMTAFGTLCLNSNAESCIKCNDICNRYGLDTISAGATVAWAIECYENGLITKEDTGGIELKWGNADAIVEITQAMADQAGFGKVLALGSAGAAAKLDKGFEYLQTVKGIELPMHDPKLAPGYARTYQFDPTPARHVKGGSGQLDGQKAADVRYNAEASGFMDIMVTANIEIGNVVGLCMFSMLSGAQNVVNNMMEAVTGEPFKSQDLIRGAMRVLTMRHAFNLREGFKPADFVLPKRAIGEPPQEEGPLAGGTVNAKRLGEYFFNFMGWDQTTGKPSRRELELFGGMDDVVQDLYG